MTDLCKNWNEFTDVLYRTKRGRVSLKFLVLQVTKLRMFYLRSTNFRFEKSNSRGNLFQDLQSNN